MKKRGICAPTSVSESFCTIPCILTSPDSAERGGRYNLLPAPSHLLQGVIIVVLLVLFDMARSIKCRVVFSMLRNMCGLLFRRHFSDFDDLKANSS